MKIVISSGHGLHIRGASGDPVPPQLDEVNEARRVVNHVADYLEEIGVDVITFHDDVSTSQSENLNRIVNFHNAQGPHNYDISVHFNASDGNGHGTEVCYITQETLAGKLSASIAAAGHLTDRGAKYRPELAFLNGTHEPAILIEVCFVDNTSDANLYNQYFDAICREIVVVLTDKQIVPPEIASPAPPEDLLGVQFHAKGKCSWFGGPEDIGVSPSEGLAFIFHYDEAPHLFLQHQPEGTSGLARRLNPGIMYVACRWDYNVTSKAMLQEPSRQARVRAKGKEILAWPADWGPHDDTDRVADLSPGLMAALGLTTDDEVEVIYPAPWIVPEVA